MRQTFRLVTNLSERCMGALGDPNCYRAGPPDTLRSISIPDKVNTSIGT